MICDAANAMILLRWGSGKMCSACLILNDDALILFLLLYTYIHIIYIYVYAFSLDVKQGYVGGAVSIARKQQMCP